MLRHLCDLAKMAVIPTNTEIQKYRSSQKCGIPMFAKITLEVFYFLSHQTLDI